VRQVLCWCYVRLFISSVLYKSRSSMARHHGTWPRTVSSSLMRVDVGCVRLTGGQCVIRRTYSQFGDRCFTAACRPKAVSRDVQRWTVHFGMSDVFQLFLGRLEPLNQNPSDATLAPLSILQNSRWRPRWPQSEWKLLK